MAFTQDELQSLNTIIEQKLSAQRSELELAFDRRLQKSTHEFEQRLIQVQQDMARIVSRDIKEQHVRFRESLQQKIDGQHNHILQNIIREIHQQQQHYEDVVEHSLAAQLLAFEQLLNQRIASSSSDLTNAYIAEAPTDFSSIEVQTEVPWEELVELIDHSFDERFNALQTIVLNTLQETERSLTTQIRSLRMMTDDRQHDVSAGGEEVVSPRNMRDVFVGIEQLEHLIEAMQVAMTANSALLSNRLFHHQQQSAERAHPGVSLNDAAPDAANGTNTE
jgi:hypothetical protein